MRFVDVVLILLFGFISISNTSNSSLDLTESTELTPSPVDTDEIIFIGVLPEGRFLVDDEKIMMTSVDQVRSYLLQEQRALSAMPIKVRIRSSKNAPVEAVFAITDLCEELGLPGVLEIKVSPGR